MLAMPAPYHLDLRERVIEADKNGEGSRDALAARFKIGVATVGRYLRRERETGSVEPDPPGGGTVAKIGPDDMETLCALLEQFPDVRIGELVTHWNKGGPNLSSSAMKRALKRFGITRKKSLCCHGALD